MSTKIGIKDISKALGISIATVSRAFNNKSDINPVTKRKVMEMANELGYKHRNLHAINGIKHTSNVIGVLIPSVNHYFFSSVLKGIMAKAHFHNYLVIVGESMHVLNKEKQILDEFIDFGVKGVLIAPCNSSMFETSILPIIHKRIPVVVIDRLYDNYKGNYIITDDLHGAHTAVEHLIQNGYSRIAHIGSVDTRSVGLDRKKGYLQALKENGIPFSKELYKSIDVSMDEEAIENSYMATKELMNSDNPPDAIFTVTDTAALGVYQYAYEHGIRIPSDLGVIGFSNSLLSKHIIPSLSTVDQNGESMGENAFQYFYNALQTSGQIFQKVLKSKLIVRESSVSTGISNILADEKWN